MPGRDGCSNGYSIIRIGADLRRTRNECTAHNAGPLAADHSHLPSAHREHVRSGPHQGRKEMPPMRADSLATTEADFFKTLFECQEGTQKHLNELAAQLSRQNSTQRKTHNTEKQEEEENKQRAPSRAMRSTMSVFLPAYQVSLRSKSGGSSSARREWETGGSARSMSSFPRVLSQAAHPTRRRPDGTKHSSASETQPRLRRSGRSVVDPVHGRETHRSRSECRGAGCDCFDGTQETPVVGREHERVRRRMTGRSPKTGQHLGDAAASDQSTDGQLETDMWKRGAVAVSLQATFVRPTSASGRTVKSSCSSKGAWACATHALPFSTTVPQQNLLLSRRLVQLHLQAEHRKCHEMTACREGGGARSADHRCGTRVRRADFFPIRVRATAKSFNDAKKYGRHAELFFYLLQNMRRETGPNEPGRVNTD